MARNIVLPTDFSDNSWNAVCYTMELFKYQACDFHVLHTYTPNTYANDNMLTAQFGQLQLENLKIIPKKCSNPWREKLHIKTFYRIIIFIIIPNLIFC